MGWGVLYKRSLILELQQRAIEFNSIVQKHQNIRSTLVERIPVLDEATYSGRRGDSVSLAASTSQGPSLNIPSGVAKTTSPPLVDLLDLSLDDVPASSSSGGDILHRLWCKSVTEKWHLDLLSIETPPAQITPSTPEILSSNQENKRTINVLDSLSSPSAQVASPAGSSSIMDLLDDFGPNPSVLGGDGPAYPSTVAFESSSLRVTFNFSKQPGSSHITTIDAHFTNKSPNVYTDFIFQAAVPKNLQLHLEPASSNTLPASGNGSITQKLRVTNSQHGKKSLVLRVRIAYKVNGNDALEEGQVSNFPRGL
ncbi:hypothetical protein Leryth_021179 [Lithospermum erythrorhizon]|nr:hypothetical protein Leryth_021179 [Lithospermum erythrorhizon]